MIKTLLLPMIKKYHKLLISIMIVSALGCTIMTGLSSSHKSLEKTLDNYVKDYNYPDGVITTEVTSRDTIKNVDKNVQVVPRLSFDTVLIYKKRYLSSRIISFGKKDFYKFYVWEASSDDGLYLDYNFAKDNNISVGDTLKFKIDNEYREYKVSKIVSTPETLAIESSSRFTGFNSDFGYIYVNDNIIIKELEKEYDKNKKEVEQKENDLEEEKKKADSEYDTAKEEINYYESLINTETNKLNLLKSQLDEAEINQNNLEEQQKKLLTQKEELLSQKEKLIEAKSTLDLINTNLDELNTNYEKLEQLKVLIKILEKLPSDTKTENIIKAIDTLANLINKLEEYDTPIDLEGIMQEVSARIDEKLNQITEDYNYLNSEETKEYISNLTGLEATEEYEKLFTTLKRYYPLLTDENIKEKIDIVYTRLNALMYIIDNSNFLETVKLIDLSLEYPFKDIIDTIIDSKETLSNYETVGDIVNDYYSKETEIKRAIESLNKTKNEIITELQKYDIKETDIDNYLNKIDNGLTEIEGGLNKINDYLNLINTNFYQYQNLYNTGINKLNSSIAELNINKRKLEDEYLNALTLYNDAKEEIKEAYKTLKDKFNYDNYCNEFLVKFNSNSSQDIKKVSKDLGVEVKNSYSYKDSNVKSRIDVNLEPIETMSTFMPIIFFIIIMIVIFLFMSLLIKQCRKEIGILRALGFSKLKIRLLFCIIMIVLSLLSVLVGSLLSIGIVAYIGNYYKAFFPIPFFKYVINYKMFISSIVITIIVSQIATLISTISIDSIKPAEAMSRDVPEESKVSTLVGKLKISSFSKFSIISMLRSKVKLVFSIICISACVMMIFASLSFITSKNYILDEVYNKRINYDAQIFFNKEVDEDLVKELNKLNYVSDAQILNYYDIKISNNKKSREAVINGLEQESKLINIYNDNNKIKLPKEGIVLEKHLADYLKVKKGDSVVINNNKIKIAEISNQSINRVNYIPNTEIDKLGKSDIHSVILKVKPNKYEDLLKQLIEKDNYLYTIFTTRSHESLLKTFKTYDLAAWIIISFAIIIGFVIVWNTSLTNLLEQKKKLSLVKALGYQHSEISLNWFYQSIIQFIISLLIGFPLGVYISKVSLLKLSTINREYIYVNDIKSYFITALLVFIYLLVSHFIIMNIFKKWSISENIKERE